MGAVLDQCRHHLRGHAVQVVGLDQLHPTDLTGVDNLPNRAHVRVDHVVLGERVRRAGALDGPDEPLPLVLVHARGGLGQHMHAAIEKCECQRCVRVEIVGQHHAVEIEIE